MKIIGVVLAALLSAVFAFGQQTYTPFFSPHQQFFDANGNPLAGGLVYTYAAGTSTPKAAYRDTSGTVWTNPIVLDTTGSANIWLGIGGYKIVSQDSLGNVQWTVDNVIASVGTGFPCSLMPTLTGDLINSLCSVTVKGLQGRAVASTAPTDQQYLGWNAAGSTWQPITVPPISVALSAPASIFSVSGSPGASLGLAFATGQTANRIYGTSAGGAAGLMAMTEAQLPWTKSGTTTVVATMASSGSGQVATWDANNNLIAGGVRPTIQILTGLASCSVGSGSSFSTCSSTYTWGSAFADTTIAITCSPGPVTDSRVLISAIAVTSTTQFSVTFVNIGTTVGQTMSGMMCHGVHL